MFKKQISLFVATFLIVGLFFLALPEKGYSGVPTDLGCCDNPSNGCLGCGGLDCAITENVCVGLSGAWAINEFCNTSDNDTCKTAFGAPGCCVISLGNCNEQQMFDGDGGCVGEGIAWFFETNCSEVPECADPKVSTPIPTLTQWGLIAMVVVLGIVGFMVIRRRKVTT